MYLSILECPAVPLLFRHLHFPKHRLDDGKKGCGAVVCCIQASLCCKARADSCGGERGSRLKKIYQWALTYAEDNNACVCVCVCVVLKLANS